MKMPSLCRALALAGLALAPVARLGAQETSLTIYNDGRVLVRRTLVTPVPRGTSEQRLALGVLDPATLFALDSGVTITAAAYDTGRGTLTVTATSSDTTGAAVLFLTTDTGFGPIQMSTAPGGAGGYTFTQKGIFPQPFSVTVLSSEGGSATAFLTIINRPAQVQRKGGRLP